MSPTPVQLFDQNGHSVVWSHIVGPGQDWARLYFVTMVAFGVVVVLLLAALVVGLIWSQRA